MAMSVTVNKTMAYVKDINYYVIADFYKIMH